jgi:hypothetical protein
MESCMDSPAIAYDAARWTSFFSAETSASAALTGLLFVSTSINLQQILKHRQLTARAGKALSTLAAVLVFSTLCLVPGQSSRALGIEIILSGLILWPVAAVGHIRSTHKNPYIDGVTRAFHLVLAQGSILPMIAGAISLTLGRGGGFYWLVLGTLVSFVSALFDAWVLLIEINR